ncbi:MAG: glycosyltransferase family 2 protein [Cytophagaceae bacterium]
MNKYFPLVTIAIPTYNRANTFLRFSLESALKQTYPNIEIIVADNCSTDNTEELVKSYKDNRIRYFRHDKNIGANNNFNFCLEQARGDNFQLLQDDDLIDEDFIETCINKLNQNGGETGIIRTGTRIIDSEGNIISEVPNLVEGLSTKEFFLGWFANKTSPYLCSTLFNTKSLKELGGFGSKHNLFQDVLAEFQLAAKRGRIDIQDIKASFRRHSGEMTFTAKVRDWCEDSLMLLDVMCELVQENVIIRTEGMRFFSKLNYNRARAVKSPFERFIAYLTVFKKFNYHYLPSKDHFLSPVYELLEGTPLYNGLRLIKKRATGLIRRMT